MFLQQGGENTSREPENLSGTASAVARVRIVADRSEEMGQAVVLTAAGSREVIVPPAGEYSIDGSVSFSGGNMSGTLFASSDVPPLDSGAVREFVTTVGAEWSFHVQAAATSWDADFVPGTTEDPTHFYSLADTGTNVEFTLEPLRVVDRVSVAKDIPIADVDDVVWSLNTPNRYGAPELDWCRFSAFRQRARAYGEDNPLVSVPEGGVGVGRANEVAVSGLAVDVSALVPIDRVVADQHHGPVGNEVVEYEPHQGTAEVQPGPRAREKTRW